MQGVEIVQGAINQFLKQGAHILYQNYIMERVPDHLNQKQMNYLKEVCSQENIQYQKQRPITSDSQPNNISKDNLAIRQIKKTIQPRPNSTKRPETSDIKKRRLNSRFSTRPTTAGKSMSSTFTKFRQDIKQSPFVKLPQPEENLVQKHFQNELRRNKKLQIQKIKELERQRLIEQAQKSANSQKFAQEYTAYRQKNMRTTFGLDGSIIAITNRPIHRKIVTVSYQINNPIKPTSKTTMTNKSSKSKFSQKHSTQLSDKNNIFTSLVYQMHSTKNSSKTEGRFYKNDQYNNNNIRQTSHANFIKLKQGVNVYEPVNFVSLNNTVYQHKQSLHEQKPTFKHYLLNKVCPENLNSLSKKNQTTNQQTHLLNKTLENQFKETNAHFNYNETLGQKTNMMNKLSSLFRPMTGDSSQLKRKFTTRPKTSNNNGRQKIVVNSEMSSVLFT